MVGPIGRAIRDRVSDLSANKIGLCVECHMINERQTYVTCSLTTYRKDSWSCSACPTWAREHSFKTGWLLKSPGIRALHGAIMSTMGFPLGTLCEDAITNGDNNQSSQPQGRARARTHTHRRYQ